MARSRSNTVCPFITAILLSAAAGAASFAEDSPVADGAARNAVGVQWPSFRGDNARGWVDADAGAAKVPVEWDVEKGDNIRWKTPIPGLAHSSPIVWNDRIFVTTAVPSGGPTSLKVGLYGAGDSAEDMIPHDFRVICLDAKDGKILWDHTAWSGVPKFARHTKATHCNSTPATDGNVVVTLFGAQGLYAYSLDGKPLWQKTDLGDLDVGPHNAPELHWGYASSPIIYDGRVYVQCDIKKDAYLAAFDVRDGRELWRVPRDDVPGWCTPSVLPAARLAAQGDVPPAGLGAQIIVNGCRHMGGYDAATGREIWRMSGGGGVPVPTPVVAGDLILFTSNHRPIRDEDRPQPIYAVRRDATGDITIPKDAKSGPGVAWALEKAGNYMQTPLAYRGLAFFCRDNGAATCYDLETGEQVWRERLAGNTGFTASPVAADGHVYWASEEGSVFVVEAGRTFRKVAVNAMGEICMATPAIHRGTLYLRTQHHLFAIGGVANSR
jgi:outer membrane protein assembly factor BamB